MGTLNRKDIAKEVCNRTGYTVAEITPIVEEVFKVMFDKLLEGDDILIKNFGRFTLTTHGSRPCTDARTGLPTMTGFKATIKFKMAKRLGDKLALLTDPKYDWGDDDDIIGV